MTAGVMLASSSSSSSSSSSLMLTLAKAAVTTTTTTMPTLAALTVAGGEQQVRTLIPLTTSTGERFLVAGPCIVLKTSLPTVAQHLQALRPLLKADNSNRANNPTTTTTTKADKTTATRARIRGLKGGFKKDDIVVGGSGNEPSALRCKRRIDFGSLGLPRPLPATMARRNERERNRVKQVNLGFETLRQHVPSGRQNKKLSKVDTLKEAVRYIKHLQQVLRDADPAESSGAAFLTTIADTIHLTSRGAVTSARDSDVTSALAVSDENASVGATSASSSKVALVDDASDVDFECEMSQTTEDEADDEDDDDFTSITPTLTFVPEIERLAAGSPFSHLAPSPIPSPGSPGTSTTITTTTSAVVFQHDHDSYNYLADRWCGGSDGASSPASPSQSSCGASETSCDETNSSCDPYHDLSPDLADWLCAKIDIEDEDVFR